MKKFLTGCITFVICLILAMVFDGMIVNYVASLFPVTIHSWIPIIKVGLWALILFCTFGFSMLLSLFITAAFVAITD